MNCILIISGTNRPGANSLKVSNLILENYRKAGVAAEVYSLAEMPQEIFDPSSYMTKPAAFLPVQERVVGARGLHVVTPEYNGSFPGVLKYFIDMLKFPESFERKPVAFTGLSAGIWGAIRSVEQLQAIFGYRNAHVFTQRVFMPGINQKLDGSGKLVDETIARLLELQTTAFAAYSHVLGST